MIIAVDFDGTLAVTDFPTIVCPIKEVIEFCQLRQRLGDIIILNTCRHGETLEEAIKWCKEQGLTFDYVNENTPEGIALYGDCRKIYADWYIDDHNLNFADVVNHQRIN